MSFNQSISEYISKIASKYEQNVSRPYYNSEEQLISQADSLLKQFGYYPNDIKQEKKKKKKNAEAAPIRFKPRPIQGNQISTVVVSPDSYSQNYNSNFKLKAKNEEHQNCNKEKKSDDLFDIGSLLSFGSEEIDLVENSSTKSNRNTEKKKKHRKELQIIDSDSLNNLLEEIEKDFKPKRTQSSKSRKERNQKQSLNQRKEESKVQKNVKKHENEIKKHENEIKKQNNGNRNEEIRNEDNKVIEKEDERDYSNQYYLMRKLKKKICFFIWMKLCDRKPKISKLEHTLNKNRLKSSFYNWQNSIVKKQNCQNLDDFNRLKEIERIGFDYTMQIFVRKFLLIWNRQLFLKLEARRKRELEIQNMNPHLKFTTKKQKLVKKPTLPPIVVNPKMDEMVRQGFELKKQKITDVKSKMKKDKKQQQEMQIKSFEEEEKKRMEHLRELNKQKKLRQMKMKSEEERVRKMKEHSNLCKKAEENYFCFLRKRCINHWKSILVVRRKQENECKKHLDLVKKEYIFKNILFQRFAQHEEKKLQIAIDYYNKVLMFRVLSAVRKVKTDRLSKQSILENLFQSHKIKQCYNEWKIKKIDSRRRKKNMAIDFHEIHLLRRVFDAFPIGIAMMKEEEKRKNLKNKLIQKAHQYLNISKENNEKDDDHKSFEIENNDKKLDQESDLLNLSSIEMNNESKEKFEKVPKKEEGDNDSIKPLDESLGDFMNFDISSKISISGNGNDDDDDEFF